MRILLIRPPSIVFTKPYFTIKPPFGLGYLSAFLKQSGHDVKILDFVLNQDRLSLRNTLVSFNPHLIGVTAYTPNVLDGFEIIKTIKSIDSKYITVIGGPHSTSIPEATLKECPNLDFVVIGEGEITFLDLCNRLEKREDVSCVRGLCYRENGEFICTSPRPLIENLDDLPFPDRGSLIPYYRQLKTYDHNLGIPLNRVMDVITSRGCTDFCTFCTVHRAYIEKGTSLRLRSAENVLEEIELFRLKYSINHISFLDDSFTINHERIKKIINGLAKMKLSWNCDTRVNLLNRDLIHDMVKAGCKKISIGVESGSEKILKLINKNITVEQARCTFRWCHEAKLKTIEANFLIGGHPDETLEDINKTRKLIRELCPQKLVVSVTVPFPGTEVRRQMLERNLIFSNDWRKYILMNEEPPPWRTTYFSNEELNNLQISMISGFYFNFKNTAKTLKYIRSPALFKTYLLSLLNIVKRYSVYKAKKYLIF